MSDTEKPVLQVLDIGSGTHSVAVKFFQPILDQGYEYELTTIDINPNNKPTYVLDIRDGLPDELVGKFDLVMCSHMFEHVERNAARSVFRSMANTLKKKGELWIIVPSLEWCADQIRKNQMTAAVYLCLYGGGEPYQPSFFYHNMGYTLPVLRDLFRMNGLVVRKAYQMPFHLPFKQEGSEEIVNFTAQQNIVIGVKVDDPVEIVG